MDKTLKAFGVALALSTALAGMAMAQPTEVRIGVALEPPALDPTAGAAEAIDIVVYQNVFEGLVRIDLPTLTPAILSAATLVFVEIVKELPATLLLRPLGIDTLATVVYARANVGLFAQAALPALFIVLAGLIPVILATRLGDRRKV